MSTLPNVLRAMQEIRRLSDFEDRRGPAWDALSDGEKLAQFTVTLLNIYEVANDYTETAIPTFARPKNKPAGDELGEPRVWNQPPRRG